MWQIRQRVDNISTRCACMVVLVQCLPKDSLMPALCRRRVPVTCVAAELRHEGIYQVCSLIEGRILSEETAFRLLSASVPPF